MKLPFPLTKTATFLIIATIVLISTSVALLIIEVNREANRTKVATITPEITQTPVNTIPTIMPMNLNEADEALTTSNTDIQSTLNQVNEDLDTLDQIDTTLDNQTL